MAVQNRLAQVEDEPEEDAGLKVDNFVCKLFFLFLWLLLFNEANHVLMSCDALFRCLSPGGVHANTYRSRVLAQGPLVLSPTR